MYSVVLAAALTAGTQSEGFFWHHHSWGCHGCYSCSSCSGCHGCWGGYSHYSGYCSGCYCSGCYCSGYRSHYCSGCYCSGCYSSCYCSGCWGCHGTVIYSSCHGCCGGTVVVPTTTTVIVRERIVPVVQEKTVTKSIVAGANGATVTEEVGVTGRNVAHITVNLPADAKLWVDNVSCPLTSSVRSFDTPALQPGQKYYYTLKVEVDRDGQTMSESQRVYVAAGQQVRVEFNNVVAATAASR